VSELLVQRGSPIPLYRQIRDVLARRIDGGHLERGAMTSEQELAAEFGVSRITVRQALEQLVREGRVLRVPGKGTFVSERRKLEPQSALTSFSENMQALGMVPGHRTLAVTEVPAGRDVADALRIEQDAPVLRIDRLLLADETPMALMRASLPNPVYRGARDRFTLSHLDRTSLYSILETEVGIALWKAKETVEAMRGTADDVELLGIGEDHPVLVVHRHTLDRDGRPVEYTQLRYRADLYRYQVELFRQPAGPAST
jgi:GntR family transcriptional regulator